jgi:hypothetical protein
VTLRPMRIIVAGCAIVSVLTGVTLLQRRPPSALLFWRDLTIEQGIERHCRCPRAKPDMTVPRPLSRERTNTNVG